MAGRQSPGIFTNDLIIQTPEVTAVSTLPVIVGGATTGPAGTPTTLSSASELIATFGRPVEADYGILAALEYLNTGQQLVYLRVGDSAIAKADATVRGPVGAAAGVAAQGTIEFVGAVQPVNADTITIPDQAVHSTGSIALTAQPADADDVILDDGTNPAVTFEFDSNSSVTQTATLRQVVIGASKEATAVNLQAAIDNAPTLLITPGALTGAAFGLTNDVAGVVGNVAITETDSLSAITLVGMAGGAANSNVIIYEFDAAVAATGNVDMTGLPTDGDTIVLDDGTNPAVTYEFDGDASVVESTTLQQVVIGGDAAATILNFMNKVNTPAASAVIAITASAGAGDSADLVNDTAGATGNVAITDAAANTTVTGMAGGLDASTVGGGNIAVTIGATALITAANLATAIDGQRLAGNSSVTGVHDVAATDPLVRVTSTPAAGVDGNLTITAVGAPATLVGFTGGVSAIAGTPTNSVVFIAKDPGTYGNTLDVEVIFPSSVFSAPADHYDVIISGQVDDDGVVQVLERFNNLSNDSADGVRFIENALLDGLSGENAPSEVLRATALATHAPSPGSVDLGATGTNVAAFTVGNDGIAGLVSTDYIGTTSGATSTGLKALRDSELVRFNIVMVPGVSHKDVITEIESLVDFRKDAAAIIDPPLGLLRDDVTSWHNGTNIAVANSPVAPLSETYSTMAWPWYKRFSSYLNKSIFLPPSVGMVQTFATVDRAAGPFIASAGFVHGLIQGSELEFNPRQEDRDVLLGGTNRVNPLIQSAQFGLTFYGNRTLQRTSGPLDSIHVLRMLIFVKRSAVDAIQTLQFQPNDPQTWRDFEQRLEPILRSVQAARGLESFSIKVDADTNPAALRAQKTMRGIITLKHIDAAEIIELDFALATTGSEFSV